MTKRFLHQLGSADPVMTFTSFSGTDTKLVYMIESGKVETVGLIQGISVERDLQTGLVNGTILFDLIDFSLLTQSTKNGTYFLWANNEFGNQAKFVLNDLVFLKERWGIAIDDIVMVSSMDFTAKNEKGWEPIK